MSVLKRISPWALALCGAVCTPFAHADEPLDAPPRPVEVKPPAPLSFAESQERWAAFLSQHVSEGRVDYAGVSQSPDKKTSFKAMMDGFAVGSPAKLSKVDQLAFWINFYNACVVEQVLIHYPIRSVKDVSGFFADAKCRIGNSSKSLDQIEKQIVLGDLKEYRAHYALVCGAVGCPPLTSEAFRGESISEQLEDRARAFINGSGVGVKAMTEGGGYRLSKIFEWYAADFQRLAPDGQFPRIYIAGYLDDTYKKTALRDHRILGYMDYDWSLNEKEK